MIQEIITQEDKKSADIFICYRKDIGADWGKQIYNWMKEEEDLNFGKVYYSEFISNANFVNDIAPVIESAKYIVVVATENFTSGFPVTEDEINSGDIVTAKETLAIMRRLKSQNPPELVFLHVGMFNEEDKKNISAIADIVADTPEQSEWLANCYITAGIHNLHSRGEDDLQKAEFKSYLTFTAKEKNVIRYNAAKNMKIDVANNLFMLPQIIKVTDAQQNFVNLNIEQLADRLINMPQNERVALIYGNGGMGKTTQLKYLCRKKQEEYLSKYKTDGDDTIYIYLPAYKIAQHGNLFRALLKEIKKDGVYNNEQAEDFVLEKLSVSKNETCAPCLLCIDGLDEVDDSAIIKHISDKIKLMQEKGVAILITSRNAVATDIAKLECVIEPLDYENVIESLPVKYRPKSKFDRLAKLLCTPFYFSMYKETVTDEGDGTIGELYKNNKDKFFYHESPKFPGELIWNYIMRHIAKSARNDIALDKSDRINYFYLLYMLPLVASKMVLLRQQRMQEAELYSFYNSVKDGISDWKPFWRVNSVSNRLGVDSKDIPEFNEFIDFCDKTFPLIKTDEQDNTVYYKFNHGILLLFFTALNTVNQISAIDENTDLSQLDISKKLIPLQQLSLIGEICGDKQNIPYYDEEWKVVTPGMENNLISRTFDNIRKNKSDADTSLLVNNLFSVLKEVRVQDDGIADLSGVDFSYLDLTKCCLNLIVFSRHSHNNKLCAKFDGAKFDAAVSFGYGPKKSDNATMIVSQIAIKNTFLITVNDHGIINMWDIETGAFLDNYSIEADNKSHNISDIICVNNNEIYVACDNSIVKLILNTQFKKLEFCEMYHIKSNAIKHLGYNQESGLYYHTVQSPIDRYDAYGNLVKPTVKNPNEKVYPIDMWYFDGVVSKDGKTAYSIELGPVAGRGNLYSAGDIIKHVWNDDEGKYDSFIFCSLKQLNNVVKASHISNGHLYFSKDEDKLYFNFSADRGKNKQSEVIVFDISKDECEITEYIRLHTSYRFTVNSMCFDGNNIWFSSYLSVYMVDKQRVLRLFCGGDGQLIAVRFMPDTKSFFTVSNNPIRIHIFDCSSLPLRCESQIIPKGITKAELIALGFKFYENMEFTKTGGQAYTEYPKQVRIILSANKNIANSIYCVDVSNGLTYSSKDVRYEDTEMIASPVVSFDSANGERFILSTRNKTVSVVSIGETKNVLSSVEVHPEWLFADCSFDGADFGEDGIPDAIKPYIRNGFSDGEEIVAQIDEYPLFEQDYDIPEE